MLRLQSTSSSTFLLGAFAVSVASHTEAEIRAGTKSGAAGTPLFSVEELEANAHTARRPDAAVVVDRVKGDDMWYYYCACCGSRNTVPATTKASERCTSCRALTAKRNNKVNTGEVSCKFHWRRWGVVELHGSDRCTAKVSAVGWAGGVGMWRCS